MFTHDTPYSQRLEQITTWLCEQVGAILGRHIELDECEVPLFALGMDSLTVLNLKRIIQIQLGITIAASMFWQYPTLRMLAVYLEQQIEVSSEQSQNVAND